MLSRVSCHWETAGKKMEKTPYKPIGTWPPSKTDVAPGKEISPLSILATSGSNCLDSSNLGPSFRSQK